ncbi:MAG: sugar phosphate isomerase/epimerase [Patescibacteria group bacterium]
MKTGISTSVKTNGENWDRISDLIDCDFNHIELYNKITRIRLIDVIPLVELKKQRNLTFSFHSMVQDLFCADEIITTAELGCLRGEIRLASLIGCDNLIFHISKKTELNDEEIKNLVSLSKIASDSNLKLCLENNFSSGVFSGDYLVEIITKIKDLNLCLDIGHCNVALNRGLIGDLSIFLNRVGDKIIELHISYNNGKSDEHLELNDAGKVYLDNILNLINKNNILAVIETKNIKQAMKTKFYLEKYV